MSEKRELLGALGLCARAGKLVYGIPMICEALKSGGKNKPVLVVEASDTSANTHKKLSDKCGFYGVPLYRLAADTAGLGRAVGKTGAVAAVGVTDANLYHALEKHLPDRVEPTEEDPHTTNE